MQLFWIEHPALPLPGILILTLKTFQLFLLLLPGATLVVSDAVLFTRFGSGVLDLIVAVFVTVVLPRTTTLTLRYADSSPDGSISGRYHVTTPVWPIGGAVKLPLFAWALTKVTPLEILSFRAPP